MDNQQKVFLEQEKHFEEIWLWLYPHYKKQVALGKIKQEIEFEKEFLEEEYLAKQTGFDNPLANFSDIASEIQKMSIN